MGCWRKWNGFFLWVFLLVAALLQAEGPAWWETQGVVDDTLVGPPPNNYAPALIGQAKWMALAAYREMEARSPGSAGEEIENLVIGFEQGPGANYNPLLIGQLKRVALPFYTRFQEEGFGLPEDLELGPDGYPWGFSGYSENNYAPATLGQLKQVFRFSLEGWPPQPLDPTQDSDNDGLPDAWELQYGFDPWVPTDFSADPDGDGLSTLEEFSLGTHPRAPDTDADGTWDGSEVEGSFDPLRPDHPAVELVLFTPLVKF